ncbi:hypothetical protein [Thermococcus radiotolerans]|uniref:Uncharacterized protein n=1 Tax=Thermococcus radiotolerans TaxID=187880 RepID=A0A2Z2MZ63_9EURY|nr:hypothetical protein [Thermococcus radiotolerans]ASJ15078.1 hypothetical protein A3L10_08035 [Thermococcus radiotolerans]
MEDSGRSHPSVPEVAPGSWKEALPPLEFVEWLSRHYPEALTLAQWETVKYLYTSESFREAGKKSGHHKNTAKAAWERLIAAFEEYQKEWELDKVKESSTPSERGPRSTKTSISPRAIVPVKRSQDRNVSRVELGYSAKTTTFKEVDQTIARVLSEELKDVLVEREVYAKLGEMVFLLLIQRGYIDVEKLLPAVNDPNAFFNEIRNGLKRLMDASDPDKVTKLMVENVLLEAQLKELERENEQLKTQLREAIATFRFTKGILDKKQRLKVAIFIANREAKKKSLS